MVTLTLKISSPNNKGIELQIDNDAGEGATVTEQYVATFLTWVINFNMKEIETMSLNNTAILN